LLARSQVSTSACTSPARRWGNRVRSESAYTRSEVFRRRLLWCRPRRDAWDGCGRALRL